jgi:hypothetical protein
MQDQRGRNSVTTQFPNIARIIQWGYGGISTDNDGSDGNRAALFAEKLESIGR